MTEPVDLANLRREYRTRPLVRADLAADPVVQFGQWFTEALDAGPRQQVGVQVAALVVHRDPG